MTSDPLSPVREALLARARDDAARVVADADEDAAATLAEAEQQAQTIRDDARAQGEADAAAALAGERSRARQRARVIVLRARREAFEDLRREAATAVERLRESPDYPLLRERLSAEARRLLGEDARLREVPAGGVLAEASGRRLDLSLTALAFRAVDGSGAEVEQLWST